MVVYNMLKVIDLKSPLPEVENPFPYPMDPFQVFAAAAISKDENVLVTAKTGTGKTLVGEYQILHSLKKGKRVFYTTPIKSLSNQKFHDLKKVHQSVGIMTGDIKSSPDADIVIMTTEILRNLLFKQGTTTEHIGISASLSLDNVDSIIFDEVHYINDPSRGKIWEECFILVPPEINLVLLSATIYKPEPFAFWLGELKQKPIHLISTEYRNVPLIHKMENGKILMDEKDNFNDQGYIDYIRNHYELEMKKKKHKESVSSRQSEDKVVKREFKDNSFVHKMNELIVDLEKTQKLPALFFVLSRKMCCDYAKKVSSNLLTSSETANVKHIISFQLHKFKDVLVSNQYFDLIPLLEKGIGFHHSGVMPILKEITEILFGMGLVKVLFATETFAVGLNMPTKTVIFTSFRKQTDSGYFRMLRPDEYTQMAGRAGRRGKDTEGIVIYLPIRDPEPFPDMKAMMTNSKPSITSRIKLGYSYVLQEIHSQKDILSTSYWKQEKLWEIKLLEKDLKDLENSLPHIEPNDMEECLNYSKINKMIHSKEKQRLLSAWENSHNGPKWVQTLSNFKKHESTTNAINLVLSNIDILKQPPTEIAWRTSFLERTEYIRDKSLSIMGTLAAEVYEGHPLLMSYAFTKKLFHHLSAEEIVVCLSIFLEVDGFEDVSYNIPRDSPVFPLQEYAFKIAQYEIVQESETYWKLSLYWKELIEDWLAGESSKNICEVYAIDEGLLIRNILKLNNLVEEWRNLATIIEDVDMLDKLRDINLIREIAIPDSLYLR
jgi:superfamily II RNA helicase